MKKKRLALIATLTLSLVACAASLAACKDGGKKDTFSAPEGVKVTQSLLTWNAVEKADNGYTVKINDSEVKVEETKLDLTSQEATAKMKEGDNKLSVKVNATDELKESEYSSVVTYKYTKPSTGKPDEGKPDDGKPDDEKPPVTGLSEAAKEFNAAVEALTTVSEDSTVAEIEEAKNALDAALAKYNALSAEDKTAVATAKGKLDEKITAYDNLIASFKADIKEIKDKVDALNSEHEITKAYYDELTALKASITALDGYAATLWAEADTKKVDDEIIRAKTTVYKMESTDIPLGYAKGNANDYFYIIRSYTNVLGEPIEYATAPTVTYKVNDGEETTESLELKDNGAYILTIKFNCSNASTIVYKVGNEEQHTLNFTSFDGNIWGGVVAKDGNRIEAFQNEKLTLNALGKKVYAYVYLSDDIDIGDISQDDVVKISGTAIATIEVSNGTDKADIFKEIAAVRGELFDKSLKVRFLFINEYEDESGNLVRSIVNSASVSELFDLTKENTKYRINLGDSGTVIGVNGDITIGAAYNAQNLAALFNDENVTAENVHEQLVYYIDVKDGDETKSFTIECPKGGSISSTIMQANIFNLYHKLGLNQYEITLRLALKEDSEYSDYLTTSYARTYDWSATLELPGNEVQVGLTPANGKNFEFLRSNKGNGYVFNFGVKCVELEFTNGTDKYSAYLFVGEKIGDTNKLYLYKTADGDKGEGTARECGTVTNGYTDIAGFNDWVKTNYGVEIDAADTQWQFRTRVIYDGDYVINDATVSDGGYSVYVTYPEENA